MSLLLQGLYSVGLYAAYLAATTQGAKVSGAPRGARSFADRRLPRATLWLMAAIGIPTTLQFFFPALLTLFERNSSRFATGEWWRIVTPLFVQDGGMSGSCFNLIALFFVGSAAERHWGSRGCLFVFLAGGVVTEVIGFAWQPVGAGNSVGNFALAGGVAFACLTPDPPRLARVMALLALSADLWLLLVRDIHGAAASVGIALVLLMRGWEHWRESRCS